MDNGTWRNARGLDIPSARLERTTANALWIILNRDLVDDEELRAHQFSSDELQTDDKALLLVQEAVTFMRTSRCGG